jgi:thioredoxin-related protein
MTRFLAFVLLALPFPALAYSFLTGYDEAPNVAAALERVKAQPEKHVLIYFGMSEFCPPCKEARAILNSEPVREKWRPNYVVVNIDLFAPTPAEREVIDQVRVSWAPVLVFLDGTGKRVAYARQMRSEKEALLLNEFVSQRQYALSTLGRYSAQDFDSGRMRRIAAEALAVPGTQRIDDRPRLRDVMAQNAERLSGSDLRKLLPGKRMHKENQEWFLTLDLGERNLAEAAGRRKDGRGEMRGVGKWYVTRKGKFCLELTSRGVDENWCRHVFRAGDTYYVTKDLRPERLAYRFTLQ